MKRITIDAVGLTREIRERMSREMEGMSKDEILRYLNDGWRPDPVAEVDSVQMMRRMRERISRDIEGMSFEEEKAYIRERLEQVRQERGASGE